MTGREGQGNASCLIGEASAEDRVRPTRPIACYPNCKLEGEWRMKRTAANARSVTATCREIGELMASAMQFVPQDRGEAMIRKWLSRLDIHALSEDRMVAVMADATLLAADLLLSYPAASGATAFDRLARSRARAPSAEAALITALRARHGSDCCASAMRTPTR